ncbi:MAG: amino acid ABC transporter permease [Blautia sp.]|nr:amino acid ABC transporter permease [Blautia sp.]
MSGKVMTAKDALYEPPGPRTKKKILIGTVLSLLSFAFLLALMIRRFYLTGQLDPKYWFFFGRLSTWRFIAKGLIGTVEAAFAAGAMAFAAGFAMMLGRIGKSRFLRFAATVLVDFTRGVPTLLFIYFFFLVVPQFGWKLSAFWKITLPVAISASGLVAEQLRSGVNAVPKGQREAALSIGMTDRQTFYRVIFPQAIRYVIPSLIAEMVIVFKDTTFAYVVNFPDLMQNAKVLISNYDALLSIYLVVAVIYILINYSLNRLSTKAEKLLSGKQKQGS